MNCAQYYMFAIKLPSPIDKRIRYLANKKKSMPLIGIREGIFANFVVKMNAAYMEQPRINILFVDDEENNLFSFKANFRIKYNVTTALSGDEGLKILDEKPIDIIITDQRMPNMTGVEFLSKAVEKHPDPMRILLTGFADMNAVIDAVNKGKIFHYLSKPWNEQELDETIQRAYKVYQANKEIKMENENLSMSNDQLEFLLRQKLLS
jgi:response regulator RpfG family c-di-GMP phosphodiesterase